MNFAPTVQNLMQEVEKWHSQFELRKVQTLEDFEEIDRLKTWYEYFLKSYHAFEIEVARRRAFEEEISRQVSIMRNYLKE